MAAEGRLVSTIEQTAVAAARATLHLSGVETFVGCALHTSPHPSQKDAKLQRRKSDVDEHWAAGWERVDPTSLLPSAIHRLKRLTA